MNDELDDDDFVAVSDAVDMAADVMEGLPVEVVLMALGNMIADAFTEGYETEGAADADFNDYIKWLKNCHSAHKSHMFRRLH